MKTAMQELIEHIQVNATKFSLMNTFNILKEIEPYLEKEKEQIIQGHFAGWSDAYDYLQSDSNDRARQAEEYYDETYNQNK